MISRKDGVTKERLPNAVKFVTLSVIRKLACEHDFDVLRFPGDEVMRTACQGDLYTIRALCCALVDHLVEPIQEAIV